MAVTGLPVVKPGASFGDRLSPPLAVLADVTPGLRTRIAGITMGRDGSVALQLAPGGVADLCQPVQLRQKLAGLTTVFAHLDDHGIQQVDVCIPDSLTVDRSRP